MSLVLDKTLPAGGSLFNAAKKAVVYQELQDRKTDHLLIDVNTLASL